MRIGVLALQGGFSKHKAAMERLEVECIEVRTQKELLSCDGLILPGGESTTMEKLIHEEGLHHALNTFALSHPMFGTCAGMILMAKNKWIDIKIKRNAYGRQLASFRERIPLIGTSHMIEALFIRAPRIESIDAPDVTILAQRQGEAVCVKQGNHLASAFHPELTDDLTLHRLFLTTVEQGVIHA